MADELEQRLESHGQAFEGLMSLIPAKLYYEQDNSDQWRRKKQTKEEKKAARKAKLDPRNIKSAKDVMDENERKRKREAGEEVDVDDNDAQLSDREARERPLEGLKQGNKNKRQKIDGTSSIKQGGEKSEEQLARQSEKRREKRARHNEKKHSDKEKEKEKQKRRKEKLKPLIQAAKEARKADASSHSEAGQAIGQEDAEDDDEDDVDETDEKIEEKSQPAVKTSASIASSREKTTPQHDASLHISQSRLSPSDVSSNPDSTFSPALEGHAATSESSLDDTIPDTKAPQHPDTSKQQPSQPSIAPPPAATSPPPAKVVAEQKESKEVLRARLESKIAALRAARKADGEDGKPIRTRQELIEHRRQKELERKQRKKKQREAEGTAAGAAATQGEEEAAMQRANAEAELARLRGDTGSPIGTPTYSRSHSLDSLAGKSKLSLEGLSYSRLAFAGGDYFSAPGQPSSTKAKGKGAMDAKSALAKAEARATRLAGMDDATRADIESKDAWQRARARVAGEKPRDDVSLLKKTLKRKEKQKEKSEREWSERKEGVAKAQEARQKKREMNLAKRREEKGAGGKKGKGSAKGGKGKKKMSADKRARQKAFG